MSRLRDRRPEIKVVITCSLRYLPEQRGVRNGTASSTDHRSIARARQRALAEALAARGWRLVVDARRPDRLDAAVAAMSDSHEVDRDRRRRRRPRPPRRAGRSGEPPGSPRSAREQREHARREPAARRSTRSTSTCFRRIFEVNVVAPLALTQALCAMLADERRHGREHHVRRRASRPTRGGAATARRRPRSSSSRPCSRAEQPDAARAGRRPRRHAHRDAPGRVPGRGHLRPAAARRRRARPRSP